MPPGSSFLGFRPMVPPDPGNSLTAHFYRLSLFFPLLWQPPSTTSTTCRAASGKKQRGRPVTPTSRTPPGTANFHAGNGYWGLCVYFLCDFSFEVFSPGCFTDQRRVSEVKYTKLAPFPHLLKTKREVCDTEFKNLDPNPRKPKKKCFTAKTCRLRPIFWYVDHFDFSRVCCCAFQENGFGETVHIFLPHSTVSKML